MGLNYCVVVAVLSASGLLILPQFPLIQCFQFLPQRMLLQTRADCSMSFENENYTILTSECKGPDYHQSCCDAFRQFACPFADLINDFTTDCNERMYDAIYLHQIPRGLFNSLCRENKDGAVNCPAQLPPQSGGCRRRPAFITAVMMMLCLVFGLS